ncbi:MAG: ribonuclease HII [Waddliaceae bacterium]
MSNRNQHNSKPLKVEAKELRRLQQLTYFEKKGYREGFKAIAGVDEAGRGPLAGPVAAAACIIPSNIFFSGVDDSKRLTPAQRAFLFKEITRHPRVNYGVAMVTSEKIDRINILQATILAMLEAVAKLVLIPDLLLVDGMCLPHPSIPSRKIVQGDTKSQSIAAASILAKVLRDRLMEEYHKKWPQYGFAQHKGYGTKAHREAIIRYGPCPIHRLTFEPVKSLVSSFV